MTYQTRRDIRTHDLDNLLTDHQFLALGSDRRIALCTDVFDLLEMAFPYVRQYVAKPSGFFESATQYSIVRGQIDRIGLFFGLPKGKHYYPILQPPSYAEEFFKFIRSPSIVTDSLNIRRQMRNFAIAAMQSFSIGPSELAARIEEYSGKENRHVLDLFIKICPNLLFNISGIMPQGQNLIRTVFGEGLVTMDITRWNVPEIQQNITEQGKWIDGFDFSNEEENSRLQSKIAEAANFFAPSWIYDIHALRLVKHLNEILNPKTVVLFVSSAPMINRMFADEDFNEEFSIEVQQADGSTKFMPILRGVGEFGEYIRLVSHLDNWNDGVDSSSVIELIEKELRSVQAKDDRQDATHSFVDSRLIDSINATLGPYLNKWPRLKPISESMYTPEGLRTHSKAVLEMLLSFEKLQNRYIGATIDTRVTLANEAVAWISIASIRNVKSLAEITKIPSMALDLFPFRIRFRNSGVNSQVLKIASFFAKPGVKLGEPETVSFYEALSSLASRSSETAGADVNFWNRDLKVLDSGEVDVLERRLVWLVILLALGHHKQVYQEVEELLPGQNYPLIEEFRVAALQGRIREILLSPINPKKRRDLVLQLQSVCEKWETESGMLDLRIRHLRIFALGTVARATETEDGWGLSARYNREWAVRESREILTALGAEEAWRTDNLAALEGVTRHLIATVASNLAYYLAIGGTSDEVNEAVSLYDRYGVETEYMTALCLHNQGYVFMRRMGFCEFENEFTTWYVKSKKAFVESDNRRIKSLGAERVFRGEVSDAELSRQQVTSVKTLIKDCVRLELAYRTLMNRVKDTRRSART